MTNLTNKLSVSKSAEQLINYRDLKKIIVGHHLDPVIAKRILVEEKDNIGNDKEEDVNYHVVTLKSRYADHDELLDDIRKLEKKEGLISVSGAKLLFFNPKFVHKMFNLSKLAKVATLGFKKILVGHHEFYPVKRNLWTKPKIKFEDTFIFGMENIRLLMEEGEKRKAEERVFAANTRENMHRPQAIHGAIFYRGVVPA